MPFNETIKQLTTQTRNHASNFNEVNNQLLENTIYNKEQLELLKTQVDELEGASQTPEWDEVTGKPSTFPPSPHNHSMEDVSYGNSLWASVDLNTYTNSGVWYISSDAGHTNAPSGFKYFTLVVEKYGKSDGSYIRQTVKDAVNHTQYTRTWRGANNGWGAWKSVDADTLDGKHATDFATASHTHTFPVTSVAGRTGVITLTKADVGLPNVQNWGASTAVNNASTTTYATASAVKQAYDKAVQAANANTDGTKVKGTVASNNLKHTISVPARNANSDAPVCKFLGKFHIANGQAGFKIEVSANSVTANAGIWTANFTARIILIPYVLGKTIPPVNSNYEYNSDYGSYGVKVATIMREARSSSEAVTTQFNASTVSGTGGAYVLGSTPKGLLVDGTYFAIFVSDGNVNRGSHTACTVKISYDAYQ